MMRKTMMIAALAAAVATGGVVSAQPAAPQPNVELRFADVAGRVESLGFLIREMERERDGFEVKATDTDGRRVRLLVDATTGQVLRRDERTRGESR